MPFSKSPLGLKRMLPVLGVHELERQLGKWTAFFLYLHGGGIFSRGTHYYTTGCSDFAPQTSFEVHKADASPRRSQRRDIRSAAGAPMFTMEMVLEINPPWAGLHIRSCPHAG